MGRIRDYTVILVLCALWGLLVTYDVEIAVISAGSVAIGAFVGGPE